VYATSCGDYNTQTIIKSPVEYWCPPLNSRKRGRKRPDEIIDPVLKRIFAVSGWTSQAELCRGLDEVESTLSRSLTRGDGVPEIILYKLVERFPRVRLAWLRDGTGEVYRDQLMVGDLPAPLQAAVRSMLDSSSEAQALLERAARLLERDHMDIIRDMDRAITGIEFMNRMPGIFIDETPDAPG
jgi:hypothetical protein